MADLELGLGDLSYKELADLDGLKRLDQEFLTRLGGFNKKLHEQLLAYRENIHVFTEVEVSELLLACAPVLEDLIGDLFAINKDLDALKHSVLSHRPVLSFKKLFVQRRARRRLLKKEEFETFAELDTWLNSTMEENGLTIDDRELAVATLAQRLLEDPEHNDVPIEKLTRWCIRALTTPEGKAAVKTWVSFRLPQGIDYSNLVTIKPVESDAFHRTQIDTDSLARRDGFKLTDPRMNPRQVQAEVNYCIYCHDHDGDFCAKGFPEKKGEPEKGLKNNPLGVTLTGCPLDEKISEMHVLKRDGYNIAALAMVMVNNPMCPATGHRICNDCMKACIYQKQTPVNIPEIETRVLTDVLNLPWGVEIYDLLTRWNPLRKTQWIPKPYNGLKVLIAGMGPAGFTLAYHLLMEGFAVVGIDGLKIEPLPEHLIKEPIRNYGTLTESLDSRIMVGFGGVAEYGITVRWDKNFLKLIYLSLMRRQHFQVFGGVRFGGTLTLETARELGFDHVAIAVGAGLPQALPIPGSLAPGMRQAADFLMALQLTGAAKRESLANLQIRMPAVVIGGGLTGIDTATEVRAYYIAQVEKTLFRYERLVEAYGETHVRVGLDNNSIKLLDEFLEHGLMVRSERERALAQGEAPDFQPLVKQWGGVTVVYRRSMQDSPAYVRNHEEVTKALEEGIFYSDCMSPVAAPIGEDGQVKALVCEKMTVNDDGKLSPTGEEVVLPARTILVATGARPNIAYHFEHRNLEVENSHYKPYAFNHGKLEPVPTVEHCKIPAFGPFTSYDQDGHRVSFIGDTHPDFNGSVVKAVASGMRSYPKIVDTFGDRAQASADVDEYRDFRAKIKDLLQPTVEEVRRLTEDTIELKIRAPLAARRYRPAQVFRLQNYETSASLVDNTRLQTETLPLTGSSVDPDKGTVSLVVRERGASSRLCPTFKKGDPIVLMGPSGNTTKIPDGKTVLVIGDWLAATAFRALGPAYKAAGNKVLLAVSFPNAEQLFCREELETASDAVIWVTSQGDPIVPTREQDYSATGELAAVMEQYARGDLTGGEPRIPLEDIDHLHITANHDLLRSLQIARRGRLEKYFARNPQTTGSIYSTMQCMLKGVCSQCLQWQIDPQTGKRTKAVFACSWQDEPLDIVELDGLDQRLSQNGLQEYLSDLWLSYLFDRHNIDRI